MGDWGIKITKAPASVTSTDWRDYLLHNNYAMFKYHSDTTQSLVKNAGDTSKEVSFAHGLGYAPAFMAYLSFGGTILPCPNRTIQPFTGTDQHYYAYADETNIYLGWKSNVPFNQDIIGAASYYESIYDDDGAFFVGNYNGNSTDGAMWFPSIGLNRNQSISSAVVDVYQDERGNTGGDLKIRTYGIDEDNTSDFSGGSPWGRSRTDASNTQNVALPPPGERWGINVTSVVQEIIARGGWNYGNSMGFIMLNNGTGNSTWSHDSAVTSMRSVLKIQKPGSETINFRVIVFKDKLSP